MNSQPAHAPLAATLDGPAFGIGVKLLASAVMCALAVYGLRSLDALRSVQWSWLGLTFMVVALGCMLLCYVWMLRSRTSISATHLRQTWFLDKQVALADITQIKLIYLPGLSWLVAPRLVVRARMPGSTVFHCADREVLRACARLALGLPPLP
jgi:hypothetical protein